MSITRLDISLDPFSVGLSGAIPERKEWSEPAMDRAILEFVSLFCGMVFKYGGRIVHGCHPTFTPIILRQARLHGAKRSHKPVTLVMSQLWAESYSKDEIDGMTDVSNFIVTPKVGTGGVEDADTRNASLTVMRRALMAEQNITVAVGGKLHERDGFAPGVGEEMQMARDLGIPRFLVGGMGGYSKLMASELTPASLGNGLSREEDVLLFGTDDIAACVNIIFKRLTTLSNNSSSPEAPNPSLP
jgi:hypothetical protein